MAWKVRFYRDLETGAQPARDWLDGLAGADEAKQLAVLAAVERVLAVHGVDVCETEWGKNLGRALYEFRVRHPATTIRNMFPLPRDGDDAPDSIGEPAKILLRLFFTTYGPGVILLLSGYDKGTDPSRGRQEREIERASEMAAKAKEGLRARQREQAKRAIRK
jgi:hypothetical protein